MKKDDRLLSLKDWVESFWNFQEEDFSFFNQLLQKKNLFDPEIILKTLKHRMKTRKAFYQFYKHLSWKDIPSNELDKVKKKIEEVLYREEIITEMTNKLLEVLSMLIETPEVETPEERSFFKDLSLQEKQILLH